MTIRFEIRKLIFLGRFQSGDRANQYDNFIPYVHRCDWTHYTQCVTIFSPVFP